MEIAITCITKEVKHLRENKAIKLAVGIVSTALFLSVPSAIAHADSFISAEKGVAGISAVLENTTDEQLEDAYNAISSMSVNSPYENLGVSISDKDSYVNIRKKPTTDSKIVGRLYRGCVADIKKRLNGDWVKIKSGKVEGYIASNFLVIGDDAKSMIDKYATKLATVNTQTLRVREKKNTKADIVTLIPKGETYVITKEYGDWVKILLGNDDDTGKDYTGFVKKEFVSLDVKFEYALTMKQVKHQEDAIEAEKQRKAELAAEQSNNSNGSSSNNGSSSHSSGGSSSSSSGSSSYSGSGSASGNKIANYALKFVGNPYVWGGTSLTHGTDCSGFVKSVYGDFGYSLPRDSRSQAAAAGKSVSLGSLRPGDLIFYANGGRVHHVAIYIGGGKIVHAANSRQGIITSNYKYSNIYCARRVAK